MADFDLPEGSVVMNVLRFVEYMTPEGNIVFDDFSCDSAGERPDYPKFLEMTEWARAKRQAPIIAMYVAQLCEEDGDE